MPGPVNIAKAAHFKCFFGSIEQTTLPLTTENICHLMKCTPFMPGQPNLSLQASHLQKKTVQNTLQ